MTNRSTPWDEIKSPTADYNVRLRPNSKSVPLFWGKDIEGRCLFITELEGDHSAQFQKERISIRGIKVDLRMLESSGRQGLVLTLEQQIDRDLFWSLCETLADNLCEVPDSATALAVALAHLKRWKVFLAGKKARILSPEEIRGLFGEIYFLRTLYTDHLGDEAAVSAWSGPEGGHQDFMIWNTAVEIKALSGKERSTVRISSEDQLETVCQDLFLNIYRLSEIKDSPKALSLNEAIKRVETELASAEALDKFSQRLAAYGYVEMSEYDTPKLEVTGLNTYKVEEEFPKLVRSELAQGLVRVGYEIELEAIAEYECREDRIWEGN